VVVADGDLSLAAIMRITTIIIIITNNNNNWKRLIT
jgi:hypothetical protein